MEWAALANLKKLRLSRNMALSSDVPVQWSAMAEASQLDVGLNHAHVLNRAATSLAMPKSEQVQL